MTATYKCPKCQGIGRIARYAGIADGVCFSCEGSGLKSGEPAAAGVMWNVFCADGFHAYNVKAKTEADALKKAAASFARASDAWRVAHPLTGATVARAV